MREYVCSYRKVFNVFQESFDAMEERLQGHGERVAYMVWKLLKVSKKYNDEEIARIVMLAFFHDIGAYRSNEIEELLKLDVCTSHKHSVYGYLFLKHLSPFNEDAKIVQYHHIKRSSIQNINNMSPDNIEKAQMLHFVDRLDVLIRNNIKLSKENLIRFTSCVTSKDNKKVESFLEIDEEEQISQSIANGTYKKELEMYFESYLFHKEELIEIVKMLVFIIDFRSPHTVTHSIYVWLMTELLCDMYKMDEDTKEKVSLAALFHDIGKISTPVAILEKNGKLTLDEMIKMKDHVVQSKRIVKGLGLYEIADILGMHHEKLDGSGYPNGLTAEEIPFEARIIMVVDIFSALVGERSYKKPLQKTEVISILNKLANIDKLDSEIVTFIIDNYDYLYEKSNEKAKEYISIYDKINREYEDIIRSGL